MFNTFYANSISIAPLAVVGLSVFAGILLILVIILKGMALWHSARRGDKWWFVIMLVLNTIGILELIYLFFIVGKWHKPKSNS